MPLSSVQKTKTDWRSSASSTLVTLPTLTERQRSSVFPEKIPSAVWKRILTSGPFELTFR